MPQETTNTDIKGKRMKKKRPVNVVAPIKGNYNKRLSTVGIAVSLSGMKNILEVQKKANVLAWALEEGLTHHLACLMFWWDVYTNQKRVL